MSDAKAASASLGDYLRHQWQALLPQRLLTCLTYRATRVRTPWFKDALIRHFARHFRVDLNEALESDARAYPDFNALFASGEFANLAESLLRPLQRAMPAKGTKTDKSVAQTETGAAA